MVITRWSGYVQGTNRGKIFVRMKNSNEALTGDIVFKDVVYGTMAAKIKGKFTNSQIIEENNIQVTYDVLIQYGYLAINQEGRISISDTGRMFLKFEDSFNQLFY